MSRFLSLFPGFDPVADDIAHGRIRSPAVPQRVYIETTIPSYLAAHPSRDLIQAARQQITHDWWKHHRHRYDLCTSQTVLDEAEAGDADAASRRMHYLETMPLLDLNPAVDEVAQAVLTSGLLPEKAARDAIHIAVASVHRIELRLTWNCRHIANAAITRRLAAVVGNRGYELPVLCTPEELSQG